MLNALQRGVDRLAATLQHAMSVDDADFNLIANTKSYDDLDDAKMHSLVHRAPSAEQREYLASHRLGSVRDRYVMSAAPELGFAYERMCVPLRSGLIPIGYLWVTLRNPLSDEEVKMLDDGSEMVARLLDTTNQSVDAWNSEVTDATFSLLDVDEQVRSEAALSLRDVGMFQRSKTFVSMCLHLPVEWTPLRGPAPHRLIYELLNRSIRMPSFDTYTFAITLPSTFLIVGYQNDPAREVVDSLVRAILRDVRASAPLLGETAILGVGKPVTRLEDTWKSFEQALVAVEMREPGEEAVSWGDRPVQEAISALTARNVAHHLLPDVLHAVAALSAGSLRILETYLRHAGDTTGTADELRLHRGTVYYRIGRLQDSLGIDLNDGEVRLAVHAWITAMRRSDIDSDRTGPALGALIPYS